MVEGGRRFLPRAAGRGTMRSMVEGASARPTLSDVDLWGKIGVEHGAGRGGRPSGDGTIFRPHEWRIGGSRLSPRN
jgi:hypothetical protein